MINSSRKAKLLWHCRRGMLELDLLLGRFTESYLDRMTEAEMDAFEGLLNYSDPELFSWLMGYEKPIDKELAAIVECITAKSLTR